MIVDYLKNWENYAAVLPCLKDIVAIAQSKPEGIGKTVTDWGFYMLQEGDTKHACDKDYEAHKKMLDIQIVLEGTEYCEWEDIDNLTVTEPYNEEKDRMMLKGDGVMMKIEPGMFYIVWPNDAHKPCADIGETCHYRKMVGKVKVPD